MAVTLKNLLFENRCVTVTRVKNKTLN